VHGGAPAFDWWPELAGGRRSALRCSSAAQAVGSAAMGQPPVVGAIAPSQVI